jgi:replication factor C subunit 1
MLTIDKMTCDLWINKWRPNNIDDIIGNNYNISKLDDWISNFDTSDNNSIIINGKHGIGKTLIVQLLLEKYNYKYKIIYPDEIKSFRSNLDFDDYYNYNNSINSRVKMKQESKKIALVFDETESITLTSERKYVFNIYKINAKLKSFPLIFISNTNHSKLTNDLKKYCPEFKFLSPSSYELSLYIKKICNEEKIDIIDNEAINMFIQFTQYDVRRLVNILQEYNYNFNTLNTTDVTKFIERSVMKDIDIGLYDASLALINDKNDFEQVYKLYEIDKVLIPLMINENYYKKVLSSKNKHKWNQQLDQMVEISDSLSIGDNIETSIYTDQNWYLQNIHGFYTCYNTSHHINKSDKKLAKTDIKFSTDLNKTSLKNINKKNITNLEKIISNKSIDEILTLCRITNHMVTTKQVDKIITILKSYKKDLDIKDLELCLKIDKTIEFITLSTKEKKEITQSIG